MTRNAGALAPRYEYWRRMASLSIWEAAYLMRGYEPSRASDIVEQDPYAPNNPRGVEPDLTAEIRMLTSAARVGELKVVGNPSECDQNTEILRESLVTWCSANGCEGVAEGLRSLCASKEVSEIQATHSAGSRAKPIGEWRRQSILDALSSLGIEPKSVPKGEPGKGGARTRVWRQLSGHPDWSQRKDLFERTWQSLRDDKEIVDAS